MSSQTGTAIFFRDVRTDQTSSLAAFLPLFLQELTERGVIRAVIRLGKHFMSLSPFFEVFSTQISSHSVISNLSYGGARYIATGRGFATTRISFVILYARFAGPALYLGMRTLLLLLYITLSVWISYSASSLIEPRPPPF